MANFCILEPRERRARLPTHGNDARDALGWFTVDTDRCSNLRDLRAPELVGIPWISPDLGQILTKGDYIGNQWEISEIFGFAVAAKP